MYKILLIYILIFISNVDIIRAQEIKSIQFDYSVVEGTNCFAIGSMQYELLGERRGINKNFVVTDECTYR